MIPGPPVRVGLTWSCQPPQSPRNDDGGVRPVLAVANSVHYRRHPRWPGAVANSGMVRCLPAGNDPTHAGERAVRNIGQHLRVWNVVGRIGARTGGPVRRRSVWHTAVLDPGGGVPDNSW